MAILLTGATGYIGSHVLANLLERHGDTVCALVRDGNPQRLWKALQIHIPDFERFSELTRSRVEIVPGDLTRPRFGLDDAAYERLVESTDSVIHCAASLNRKSERACLNLNLRGALEVFLLARRARDDHGLRRFSLVSTVAVAGERNAEVVTEDEAIDWSRRDYDPYARTKKFGEHMLAELLPDVDRIVFRPSTVLGDSRRPETTSFEMVRAFVFLARLPAIPLESSDLVDIVPVDYVADAIEAIHCAPGPARYPIIHLSSGRDSPTFAGIARTLAAARGKRPPWFWPWLAPLFGGAAALGSAMLRGTGAGRACARLQVFMPYLVWNTVFDNARVVALLGRKPPPFSEYCADLMRFSLENDFSYPYREWPDPS